MRTPQQQHLLTMLKEIDTICTENNIEYFLAGGTLIGAVRHRGFLPWDDDADLYMTRDNWNKFVAACEKGLPPNRVLQAPDLDLRYTNTFPRYASTDTVAIHSHQVLDGYFTGEVIDILILDPIIDDPQVIADYTYDLMLYSDLINYSAVFGRRFGVRARDYLKYLLLRLTRGERYLRDVFEEKLAGYLNSEGSKYVMRWGGNPLLFDREWFGSPSRMQFEDFDAMVPNGIDEYLIYHYGDEWYQVPTNANQAAHDTAASLVITAAEAEDICQVPRRKRRSLRRKLAIRKAFLLASAPDDYQNDNAPLQIESAIARAETERRFAEVSDEFSETFSTSDIKRYESCFARYIDWQMSARIAGRDDWKGVYRFRHPIHPVLADDTFDRLILYLFNTESLGKAARLLDIREQSRPLTDASRAIRKQIFELRQARVLFQEGDAPGAYDLVAEILEEWPQNVSALKIAATTLLSMAQAQPDNDDLFVSLEAILDSALALYPQDGDFVMLTADYSKLKKVEPQFLSGLYRDAAKNTHNGLNLLHIGDELAAYPENTQYIQSIIEPLLAGRSPFEVDIASPAVLAKKRLEKEYSQVFLDLFTVFSDVCQQAGVNYFVSPFFAYMATQRDELADSLVSHNPTYSPLLKASECQKLLDYISRNPLAIPHPFAFEYMGTNPYYPHLTLRLVKMDTARYRHNDGYNFAHNGLGITIHILRPRKIRRLVRGPYSIWRSRTYKHRGVPAIGPAIAGLPLRALPLRVQKVVGDRIFRSFLRQANRFRKVYAIRLGKQEMSVPVGLFAEQDMVSFNGRSYPTPKNMNAYIGLIPTGFTVRAPRRDMFSSSPLMSYADTGAVSQQKRTFKAIRRRYLRQGLLRLIRRTFVRTFTMQKRAIAQEDHLRLFSKTDALVGDLREREVRNMAKLMRAQVNSNR